MLSAALLAIMLAAAPDADLPTALDAGWKGKQICEKLFENDYIKVGRCTFEPGDGHERHFHPPHFGYILKGGVMQITDATGTHLSDTRDGANWWSDGVDWHEAVNIGDTTTVYLIIEPKQAAEKK